MAVKGRSIVWKEQQKTFESLKEASRELNLSYSRIDRLLRRYAGECTVADGITLQWEKYTPEKGEKFRPIPGYEGKYSISNKRNVLSEVGQRLLKPGKQKTNRGDVNFVMLYKDGLPSGHTIAHLFRLTWPELVTAPIYNTNPKFKENKKKVECLTDSILFDSYMDCCRENRFDYQEFRKAVRKAVDGKFRYKGKEFALMN